MSKVTLDQIRSVRARVERSVPECRAALERSNGDIDAAVESLLTPLERIAERKARLFEPGGSVTIVAQPRERLSPSNETGHERVLADLGAALAAAKAWTGKPDPAGVEAARLAAERQGRPLPATLLAFWSRWNGVELNPSERLWGCTGHDSDTVDGDHAAYADAFTIGAQCDAGYLFLHAEEVWLHDFEGAGPIRVAPNLESFLRDLVRADLSMLTVIEDARDRAGV